MSQQRLQENRNPGQRRTSGGHSLPSYTQRVAQRMTREEAVKAVVRMMAAYTGFRCSEESMLVLAEVLMQFPLETATAAASPIHGAPKKYREKPLSAGQLTEWCERAAECLYQEAKLERARLPPPPAPPRLSEAEMDALFAKHGLLHLRPGSKCAGRPEPPRPARDSGWKAPTDAELRAHYGTREAAE